MTFVDVLNIIGYVLIVLCILYVLYCIVWWMNPSYGAPKRKETISKVLKSNYFVDKDGMWHSYQKWVPSGQPKCILFFFHGMSVYAQRYNNALELLRSRGCLIYGMDYRGHGCSDGIRCYIRDYKDFVCDEVDFVHYILDTCPDYKSLPLFTMGHSLGGGLCIIISEQLKSQLNGAISLSPCIELPKKSSQMRGLAGVLVHIFPRMPLTKIPPSDLSHDAAMNESYSLDPLAYTGGARISTGNEIFNIGEYILSHLENFTYPFFVAIGKDDNICSPSGVQKFYEHAASQDKTIKTYDNMLHDILFESISNSLVDSIDTFINEHLTKST